MGKQLYGLVGFPVAHSLSKKMQEAAFKDKEIDAEYKLFEVKPENLESFLTEKAFEKGLAGFNITIPHKIRAREILEKNFPGGQESSRTQINSYYVKLTGAVNTVKVVGKRLEYFNTDASGFRRSLQESLKFDQNGKEILLIGCGGAGRAVIAALGWRNLGVKRIYIYDTNGQSINSAKEHFSNSPHADFLPDKLQFIQKDDLEKVIKGCSLLVNASPIGMKNPKESPIDKNLLPQEGLNIFDVVYNKEGKTQLIKDALARDLPVAGGLEMLLYQGADAFSIWTQQEAPIDEMRKALNKGIQ